MKYLLTILIIISSIVNGNTQTSIRQVVNTLTDLPVSYATIKIYHTTKGIIASEEGKFDLEITPSDTIMISCAGYKSKVIIGNQAGSLIFLNPRIDTLQELVVKTKKIRGSIVLGNGAQLINKNIKCKNFEPGSNSDCWPWRLSSNHAEYAEKIYLPDTNALYQLRKIYIPVTSYSCWEPLLLRFYSEDDSSGLPGEELFLKPVYITKETIKYGKIIVDLSSDYFIIENKRSIFISIGWMPKPANSKCTTQMLLFRSNNANTFSRTLSSAEYQWQKEWTFGRVDSKSPTSRNTLLAVQVDILN